MKRKRKDWHKEFCQFAALLDKKKEIQLSQPPQKPKCYRNNFEKEYWEKHEAAKRLSMEDAKLQWKSYGDDTPEEDTEGVPEPELDETWDFVQNAQVINLQSEIVK